MGDGRGCEQRIKAIATFEQGFVQVALVLEQLSMMAGGTTDDGIYFVAETKGSMSSLALRDLERSKIDCARKLFDKWTEGETAPTVRYDVVDSYASVMDLVNR